MTPPKLHIALLELLSAGIPPINTVGEPGNQGVASGVHGMGVRTPMAAAVAEATLGFAMEVHTPKGNFGKSIIVAAG